MLRQTIHFIPGYHDQTPGGAGIHGMHIAFVLRSSDWAVCFDLYTGWTPSTVERDWDKIIKQWHGTSSGWGISEHTRLQLYEDQFSHENCGWLDGDKCYYDGSGLDAGPIFIDFVNNGEQAIWDELHRRGERLQTQITLALQDLARYS